MNNRLAPHLLSRTVNKLIFINYSVFFGGAIFNFWCMHCKVSKPFSFEPKNHYHETENFNYKIQLQPAALRI